MPELEQQRCLHIKLRVATPHNVKPAYQVLLRANLTLPHVHELKSGAKGRLRGGGEF